MLESIIAYNERHSLLPEYGQIVVAVSGGTDSLCLLHLLYSLCGTGKRYPDLSLHVAHLNHLLRPEVSSSEAAYVARIAADWGLPVTIGEVDVPTLARREHRSLEDAARVARYRFLRQVAQGNPVAVAHHADDQVETLLLHWLRGGGLAALTGMQPRQQDIIRPLLAISRAEIERYCQLHHLTPVEDASNTDLRFLRNRIRHELLPLLESMNPGMRTTLLRTAEVVETDLNWIEAQVDGAWSNVVLSLSTEQTTLARESLASLPLSIQRHLLRRVTAHLCEGQSPLELRHYTLIESLMQQGRMSERGLDLPAQLQVRCNLKTLILTRHGRRGTLAPFSTASEALPLSLPGRLHLPDTPWIVSAELLAGEQIEPVREALSRQDWSVVWRLLPATRHTVYIDADTIDTCLFVRTRHPGDRIRPLGMKQEKKVQDVLVNSHIPRMERSSLPLFFSATHCVWMAGVCLDDRVRLTAQTRRILCLSIAPDVPEVEA